MASSMSSSTRWAIAPPQKLRPITEARCRTVFDAAGKPIDARADQRLDGVGDPVGLFLAALLDAAHDLFEEERVALGLLEQQLPRLGRHRRAGAQRVDQLFAVSRAECLELDRRRAHAASAPVRAHVEELGPRQAEHEKRLADPGGDALDQLEQRLFRPVDVLEDEHERLGLSHQLGPLAGGPGDLLLAALAVDRLEHAGRQAEQIGDRFRRAAVAKLLDRDLQRVVVGDAGNVLDHLGERPVRDALAVGKRSSTDDGRALERFEELVGEPRLAHAGLAVDREEMCAPVPDRARVRVLEELELVIATDDRRDDQTRRGCAVGADRRPRPDRLGPAADLDRPEILRLDPAEGEPVGARPDDHLARLGGLLQSRGEVDCVPGREGRVGGLGDHLSGFDSDPRRQVDRLQDRERRLHGALGVVLV